MRTRALLIVLSLVMAIVPSWAVACAASASLAPCHEEMSASMASHDCCDDGQSQDSGSKAVHCSMASVCNLASAVPLTHSVAGVTLALSVAAPSTPTKIFVSAHTFPPFRPPIA